MKSQIIWQGVAVGFLAAIPLGPMGMVCVQRTLQQGRLPGLVSACGLTLAAAFWCVVAARGLSAVGGLLTGHETAFTVALGMFLVVAGLAGLRTGQDRSRAQPVTAGTLSGHFLTSLLGVILNPITFVTMTAVLAILGGVSGEIGVAEATRLAGAVVVGGMTFWLGLTHGVWQVRERLGDRGGARLSRALNYSILALGIVHMIRPFLPDAMG